MKQNFRIFHCEKIHTMLLDWSQQYTPFEAWIKLVPILLDPKYDCDQYLKEVNLIQYSFTK